ncbi:unnamed protein product [Prunus armeniaca]
MSATRPADFRTGFFSQLQAPIRGRPVPNEPPHSPLSVSAIPASIHRLSRRNPPRNRRCWTVFDRTSNLSFSVIRPPNWTSEQTFGLLLRPLPASFWGRSKNKSGSKYGVLPRIGVLSRDVEIFLVIRYRFGQSRTASACGGVWAL